MITLQSIFNSRLGVGVVLGLGKLIPPRIGYRLGESLAAFLSRLKHTKIVRSVRSNQWVVSGQKADALALNELTRQTFVHTAQCLYDFYHNMSNPEQILSMVSLSDRLHKTLRERSAAKKGTIFIAPHLSNFDLAGRAMALHGYQIQVLSYPQPPGGYQWQNKMRKDFGIEITPMSTESLRQAKQTLREGGAILTGMDRPLESSNYHPLFFGHPASVPVSYVRLGIMTNSPVVVVACQSTGRGKYVVDCSEPIEMKPNVDVINEIEQNAQRALFEAEKFIKVAPSQWSMFYPVWPWALEKMP